MVFEYSECPRGTDSRLEPRLAATARLTGRTQVEEAIRSIASGVSDVQTASGRHAIIGRHVGSHGQNVRGETETVLTELARPQVAEADETLTGPDAPRTFSALFAVAEPQGHFGGVLVMTAYDGFVPEQGIKAGRLPEEGLEQATPLLTSHPD